MEENEMIKSTFSYLESIKRNRNATAEDSDHQFGLYIASELRSIKDENIKKLIKHKMQCILYELQLGTVTVRQGISSIQPSSPYDLNKVQPPYTNCLSASSSCLSPKASDFSSVSDSSPNML